MLNFNEAKIAVIGLGYVGLPVAVAFGEVFDTLGFDIDLSRIHDLQQGFDKTLEVEKHEFAQSNFLKFTNNIDDLRNCNFFIITVPTPIDQFNRPLLKPIFEATKMVAKILKKNDIVVYESTVYPGLTEEECAPILENISGLKFNVDFFCGYSPERINPGDKTHKLKNIMKITSGSTDLSSDIVNQLYNRIITAGTFNVKSIKIAEAAKVIENTQRDLNIALINEFAIILNKLNIDTESVLKAAATKWNFLPFWPGLVGGHCIGVDPYYLTFKAQAIGYNPEIILAGRKMNDGMGKYVVSRLVKKMLNSNFSVKNANVLILGFTFKENCPDIRNTRVLDIVQELKDYEINCDIYDPWVSKNEVFKEYGLSIEDAPKQKAYDAIIIAVAHNFFKNLGSKEIRSFGKSKHILFDIKYIFNESETDLRL